MKIVAVVVTYNRKALLLECLTALEQQTCPLDRIILIDNASTDGTAQALQERGFMALERLDYHRMPTNLGGAGGFHAGMEMAKALKPDWVWIMDDDTIARPDSLMRLRDKAEQFPEAGFLASCVEGPAGEPMNVPEVDKRPTANGYSNWYGDVRKGVVRIQTATFVSVLISGRAMESCGLPCRELFLWGDDTEYTFRITHHYAPGYLVGDSWVCHKRADAAVMDIRRERAADRLKNYWYFYRNTLIINRLYREKGRWALTFAKYQLQALCLLFSGRAGCLCAVLIEKGLLGFVFQYSGIVAAICRQLHGKNCAKKTN